ncbi:hypothetical protein BP6252_03613 [Coleophoma cylindrospora]|uniref:Uncharacterized protein n=1 Tax=Coleophoma cylindrospora TaxID=1849047 RepID=A0A3D8S8P0_9HELO|nr:hypothetical protein BP6252_03613 [Coleophoma cylindrospora]
MDIHRCRFVPYPPSTINSLAFTHSHLRKGQKAASPRLAVGRANGDIEIWNPSNGTWLQETIIRGGVDRSVDALVWTQDPNEEDINGRTIIGKSRLFSVGYTTTVTEWDLEKGRPLRQTSGNHGEIWCLAAQPALPPNKKETKGDADGWEGQHLVTGCTDGALVLYSTADDDLQLKKVLVRPSAKKAKVISVTFQDRNHVVAGCTDSTIRIYDIRNGSSIRSMTLGSGPSGGPKEIIVWTVKVLANGNIVSGDSSGEVRIWDGKNYTLMQRIKGHRQDILSLATSFDGSAIFSGGMDRRTVVYKQVGGGKARWAEVGHRRYHDHDVKTMATLEAHGMSVVVSGGPDASPVVLPLQQFGLENQRALPYLPQEPALRSSSKKRLMMSWWEREISIWRLKKASKSNKDDNEEPAAQNRKLVSKILIKGEASITSATLSTDGEMLAVSTINDIKMFQLRSKKGEEGEGLRVSKITVPNSFSSGARLVEFSPDGKWICIVRSDSRIAVARILSDSDETASSIRVLPSPAKLDRIDRQIEKHILLGGLGSYDRTVTKVAFSSDSRILAVGDLAGYIDTWVLSGSEDIGQSVDEEAEEDDDASSTTSSEDSDSEDSEAKAPKLIFGQHWTRNPSASLLPKLPNTPTVFSFRPSPIISHTQSSNPPATRTTPRPVPKDLPSGEDRLVILTANNAFFEFAVLTGTLSPWSRRNQPGSFPAEYRKLKDQARGCIWDISSAEERERVWVYGIGWLWMFDLSRDFAASEQEADGSGGAKKKRKRDERNTGAGDAIPDNELVSGIGRKMQRIIHEEVDEELPLTRKAPTLDPSESMDLDQDSESDTPLRRNDEEKSKDVVVKASASSAVARPMHWSTYKYRPILGIIDIGPRGKLGPEVALVERPIWEADLPPRFYGDQEWEKADY